MTYELWDFETGNAIGEYATLAAALNAIRDASRRNGAAALAGLSLLEVDAEGVGRLIAQEQDIAALLDPPDEDAS